ncbi:hypothetical protein FE257_009332 [Aspergillus nanangensis]|uniref:Heterokaryon incompatibility domain-containing protein n=1 Tax=Aspergillus nanangensis TaxID=2582783 RepID=A0AAD4CKQ0_ASPNN|nr:hypothetical protein FE257_009332 [Aspergillus nanangensis]
MANILEHFEYERLPSPTSIRLLRLDGTDPDGNLSIYLKIVDLEDKPWYHAFSYTWNNPHSQWEALQEERDAYSRKYPHGHNETVLVNGKALSIGRGAYDALTSFSKDAWAKRCSWGHPTKGLRTAVHWGALMDSPKRLRQLISSHADVNVRDENGVTPLIFATRRSKLEFVEMLLAAGADPAIADNSQKTALDHARQFDHEAIIQRLERAEKEGQVLKPDTTLWPDGPQEWCWIDQVCINQVDTHERNVHVSMMDEVYANACFTVTWLGPQDRTTQTAIQAINKLYYSPKPFHETQLTPYSVESEASYAAAGVPPISREEWQGLAALFLRPYFRRLWIFQESVLSGTIMAFCGQLEIPWEPFHTVAQYLFYRQKILGTVASRGFIRRSSAVVAIESQVVDLAHWRERMQLDDDNDAAQPRAKTLENLLFDTWTFQSADPRDKIFGLYGLLNKARRDHAIDWRPDYTMSVARVFADTTRRVMTEANELRMLSAVLDKSLCKQDGLPSWVPDYSVPFSNMRCANYQAAGALSVPPHGILQPSSWNVLRISGVKVDTVLQTGNATSGPNQFNMFFDPRWFELTLLIPQPYHNGRSRTDALWRTLCADQTLKGVQPAPEEFGHHFRVMLCLLACIKATETQREIDKSPEAGIVDLLSARYHVETALAEPPLSDLSREELQSMFQDPTMNLSSPDHQTLTHLLWKLQFLTMTEDDSWTPNMAEIWSTYRSSDAWRTWDEYGFDPLPEKGNEFYGSLIASHGHRRLFVTEKRYMGLGPSSMVEGDQLWVFPGAGAVFVMRPADGANEFHLVGEAYLHGGMEGELLGGVAGELCNVDLV